MTLILISLRCLINRQKSAFEKARMVAPDWLLSDMRLSENVMQLFSLNGKSAVDQR